MREYWVFGYGSLIWKPPPHAVEKRSGYVKGVIRRFAQSSIDHRGTPEAPGRVVTVIEADVWHSLAGGEPGRDEDYVWGMAYRIDPDKADEVKAYMEYREKVKTGDNGYTCHDVDVYTVEGEEERVTVHGAEIWIGKVDNEAFIGYEPPDQLAATILARSGPSGPNRDYLYKLAESVRSLYPHVQDHYLFDLEARVKRLEQAALSDSDQSNRQ